MEKYLKENFEVDSKRPSEEALRRWRSSVWLVKNPRRRFRMVANLAKRQEVARKRVKIQERIRVALYVQKAALHFIDAGKKDKYIVPEEARKAGFNIHPDDLASIVRDHNLQNLKAHGGLNGIASKIVACFKNGVKSSDTKQREIVFGLNRFAEKPVKTLWKFVWDSFQDLTLLILMVCAIVSIFVGIPTQGWPKGMYDGLGIIFSIILVVMVTAVSDYKQSLQFNVLDIQKKKNIKVNVTRDGQRNNQISINDLVVGDIVILSIGDQVPADGLFISGFNLSIDESSLSGESEPVQVTKDKPFLLSGSKVKDGSAKMLVTAVGMKTEWGSLMETLSDGDGDGDGEETPLQVKLNGVATIIGKIGLGFAVVTFFVLVGRYVVQKIMVQHETTSSYYWTSDDALVLLNYFATAVTIIVVAVPEGLPLAVTLSLAFAMNKLMNDKALVRHLSACETMGSATCICTDKTGTLTTNHMVVTKLWVSGNVEDVSKKDSLKPSSICCNKVLDVLLEAIFLNTSCEVVKGDEKGNKAKVVVLGSPTETAILELGMFLGGGDSYYNTLQKESNVVKFEPFNSLRKKMSVLVQLPQGGLRAYIKGASEIILKMCDNVLDPNGESIALSEVKKREISQVIDMFASEALRTLCLAYKDIIIDDDDHNIPEDNLTLIAVVGIKDPVRPGVKEAVQTCLAAGIHVRMVTGDNIHTAQAIATECGILTSDGLAFDGSYIRNKSPEELQDIIPNLQVLARSMPLDKHSLVNHLRQGFREVVAVTGDGTNDAPALHEADIGLAMGLTGTEVAKENADIVIMDDNFETIVKVIRWGRSVFVNIQKFVQFQLTVNIVALVINFTSACISGSAPLTAVQLLWVNMIMDTLGALALATEPPNDELMKRPPVRRDDNFITNTMWRNIIGQSLFQLASLAFLQFYGKELLNLNGPNATKTLNTFIFNVFVFFQVFNEINSRDMEKINVVKGIMRNWVFLSVIASTVIFQFIIVQFLGTFADTVPLNWNLWLLSVVFGSISFLEGALLKCVPVDILSHIATTKHHDGYEALPSGPQLA